MVKVDEETKKSILFFLSRWKTSRVNKDKLWDLKEELIKRTGAKTISFSTLKKWVRQVAREAKQAEKLRVVQYETPITTVVSPISDRLFYQSMAFNITAMKKTINRLAAKTDEIKKLSAKKPRWFKNTVSSDLTIVRKMLETMLRELTDIERNLKFKE